MNGYFRIKDRFYGLSDIPTVFQEKMDEKLNYQTPVRLYDIIIVTKGVKEKHRGKILELLEQLQEAGYRASEKKFEFFSKKLLGWGTK